MSDLTNRLRCRYPSGPIMKNGEPEFGWRDFSGPVERITLPTSIMKEAADRIEQLERENAEMEAIMSMIATADENGICDNGYSAGYIARGATETEGGEG